MKFSGKWLPDGRAYREACLRLSKNLDGFKVDPEYMGIVGNDTRGPDVVEAFDKVVKLPYVSSNDAIGSPVIHNGKSAGTLRYIKVVQDLLGCGIKSVVEIGGGYGGQCLVVRELLGVEYTIIDIPEALELSRAYLGGDQCTFISDQDVPELSCDLFLSDYCLGEMDPAGMDFYFSRVKALMYYITCNETSADTIMGKLKSFCSDTYIEEENPRTSRHRNYLCVGRS